MGRAPRVAAPSGLPSAGGVPHAAAPSGLLLFRLLLFLSFIFWWGGGQRRTAHLLVPLHAPGPLHRAPLFVLPLMVAIPIAVAAFTSAHPRAAVLPTLAARRLAGGYRSVTADARPHPRMPGSQSFSWFGAERQQGSCCTGARPPALQHRAGEGLGGCASLTGRDADRLCSQPVNARASRGWGVAWGHVWTLAAAPL